MNRKGVLGRAALFGTAFIWGTSFVILKTTLDSVGALWILAIRFSTAALIIGVFCMSSFRRVDRKTVLGGLWLGLCLAVAYVLQTYGLAYTTPGKNAFLTASYCVLVPFLAWAVYAKKPTILNIAAAFLCIGGIGCVSLGEGFSNINTGDMLTLGCGLFYALQIIILDRYLDSCDTAQLTIWQFVFSAAICWVCALIFEPAPVNVPASAWWNIAYLSVMCTGVCFFFQAWGMKYTPAPTASVIMTFESTFAALISVLFYDEKMTLRLAIGFVLILGSVILAQIEPKKKSGASADNISF